MADLYAMNDALELGADIQASLERAMSGRISRDEALVIQRRALLVFVPVLGEENPAIQDLVSAEEVRPPATLAAILFSRRSRSELTAALVRQGIESAMFALRLQIRSLARGIGSEPPASGLNVGVADALLARVATLIADVEASIDLTRDEREQLLDALRHASDILRRDDKDANLARRELRDTLGAAVAKTARGGPASVLWKRFTELVVLAEAAVSLGLGVAAIKTTPTHVEIVCRVEQPTFAPSPGEWAPPKALPAPPPTASTDITTIPATSDEQSAEK